MLSHDQKCKNKKCKENGWNKLKVVDVEYIGCTEDEIDCGKQPAGYDSSDEYDNDGEELGLWTY